MLNEVVAKIKMQIVGGCATPAPPVGPALGGWGVNIYEFCKKFNAQTQQYFRDRLPVVITVYKDKSCTFVVKQPTAASLLKRAAEIAKGSGEPNKVKAGSITRDQLREITVIKMPDLGTTDLKAAMRTMEGTARSMGIEIREE